MENVTTQRAVTFTLPKILLHLEGLAVFISALVLYANQGGNWLLFIALLFVPDVGMVGYFANPRVGALTYNLVHTYVAPLLLLALGLATSTPLVIQIAIIWFAHIGMDRTVGYGLKYATAFKQTHLGRV